MGSKSVADYLAELEAGMESKPEQVREGIEVYVGLWRKAVERGVVLPTDEVGAALAKIEEEGGLYRAAGE